METFQVLASPFWVNLFILIPFILWFAWKKRLNLTRYQLITLAIFAIAFGILEAIIVVYLRYIGQTVNQAQALLALPDKIVQAEMIREACTLIILTAVAISSANKSGERLALFFYSFSIWDLTYYLGLKLIAGWPDSLTTQDVLFLLPVPWLSQVWFPILVSFLIILVVLLRVRTPIAGA